MKRTQFDSKLNFIFRIEIRVAYRIFYFKFHENVKKYDIYSTQEGRR